MHTTGSGTRIIDIASYICASYIHDDDGDDDGYDDADDDGDDGDDNNCSQFQAEILVEQLGSRTLEASNCQFISNRFQ